MLCISLMPIGLASGLPGHMAPGVDDVRFRKFNNAEGLSQPTVRAIAQDPKGFIWLGTQDGLNRFDGHGIRVYRHDPLEPGSLSGNYVVSLAVDEQARLWVATRTAGLNRYDPGSDAFTRYRSDTNDTHSLASDALELVLVDSTGQIWVQPENAPPQRLDEDTGRFHSLTFTLPETGEPLRLLTALPDGRLLLAADQALLAWRPGNDEPERLAQLGRTGTRLEVAAHDPEHLWIGTEPDGLFQLGHDGGLIHHWRRDRGGGRDLIDDQVSSLMIDSHGAVWVGTLAGLSRISPDQTSVRSWRHDPGDSMGLSGARIVSLLEDRTGLIWAGTWTGGASIYDPQTSAFTLVRNRADQPRSLPGNAIADVLENPDGTLWVATLDIGELVHFDPRHGVVQRYRHDPDDPDGLPHRLIGSVLHDGDGLLVGTLGGGLVRLNPDTGQFSRLADDPADDVDYSASVERLQHDREGTLWVSTLGHGLYHRCAGCTAFDQYYPDPEDPYSIGGSHISGILETTDGQLWVALRRDGLNRLDRQTGRFEHFTADGNNNGLRNNSVTGLYQATDGQIWLGTQGGGLHRLETDGESLRFTAYGRADGLNADAIGEIAEDSRGRIWVSTTAGLSRINPATEAVENFALIDGHASIGFFIGSIDRHPPSHVWFGGVGGLIRLDLNLDGDARIRPRVVLTDLLLFNQPLQPGTDPVLPAALGTLDELIISHDQSLFTIEFVAPGLMRQARDLRYNYRLLDLTPDWVETGPERAFATFTALPAGDYTLQVRAGTRPGDWGPVTELPVRVLPPPWRSGSAIIFYSLAFMLLVLASAWRVRLGLMRRYRAQREIAESRERLRLALWGSRDELWEANMQENTLVRENRIDRSSPDDNEARMTLDEFWSVIHSDDITDLKRAFIAHARGESEHFEAEFRVRSAHGTWHWMLSRGRVTLRDENGKALLLSGTSRDITSLKHTEDALRRLNEELESRVQQRTAELEKSNQTLHQALQELQQAQRHLVQTEKMAALGGLVAGIAHEINTPLGVGVTAASHLDSETRRFARILEEGQTPSEQQQTAFTSIARQSCQLILRNLRRADELVRSFKQVAVDQASEQRRTFRLSTYMAEILISLHPELKRLPHVIEQELPEGLVMDTYPGALYQVMVNLIMNSIHHAFEPDQAGIIRIAATADGDWIDIIYSDNGKGMSEDVAEKMFDPFFTTRRGQGGSGLGLHISYNLVTQILGGDIKAETAPGKGVRFEIRLPRVISEKQTD